MNFATNCHLLAPVFLKFCCSVLGKTFFVRVIYGLYLVCGEKRMIIFIILVCFAFFIGLLLSVLYKQLLYMFQLPAILDCSSD